MASKLRLAAWLLIVTALAALARPAAAQTSAPPAREEVVFLNEQRVLTPAYAVGNIAIGDPRVADYKVMPGRKEILVFGKGAGGTLLTLWDQRNVKREEILITVTTRQQRQLETDLRSLLAPFPAVEVRAFAGELSITGAVSAQDDLAAIDKIAAAAKVRNLVRYVPPTGVGGSIGGAAAPGAPGIAGGEIEYEIELLEASSRFRSGSYATGVEPSGRSLYKGVVRAPLGATRDIFIGGTTVAPARGGAKPQTVQSGLKLTLTPTPADSRGRFQTTMLIETNLPFGDDKTYDPTVWRKARWEMTTAAGEPFGITGAELLAVPDASGGGSKLGSASRAAQTAAGVPRVSGAPGTEYVPVFGSLFGSSSYKKKTTQLLMILRPKVVAP